MDRLTHTIKTLSECDGVSGYEQEVARTMDSLLRPLSDEVLRDRLGGIVGVKRGQTDGPRILIAGHLDEIGFMITHITDDGFLRFQQLGGWWPHSVLSQRVRIKGRSDDIIGIVGAKAPHVLSADERGKVMKLDDMFIDVGASNKEEARGMGISPGDAVVPVSDFVTMGGGRLWAGKALDNRAGCALAVEVLEQLREQEHPNVVYAGATVQEEIGMRGAGTLAELVKPDIAIAIDVGVALDTPGMDSKHGACSMDKGPLLVLFDATMVPHTGLRRLVMDAAADLGIELQTTIITAGGTDAGKFHLRGTGCPSIALGFATRYIHTHSAILSRKDFEQTVMLVTEVVKRLNKQLVEDLCS